MKTLYIRLMGTPPDPESHLDKMRHATCSELAEHNLSPPVTVYSDVRDDNEDRPGLRRRLADAEAGIIDTLVITDISQLARSCEDLASICGQLTDCGVGIVTLRPFMDYTTAAGQMEMQFLRAWPLFRQYIAEFNEQHRQRGIAEARALRCRQS